MEPTLSAWIEAHTRAVEPLFVANAKAEWQANVTGCKEDEEENARLEAQLRKYYSRREDFEQIRSFQAQGRPSDPLLARQLERLHLAYLGNQMDPAVIEELVRLAKSLEGRFNNFRAELDGRQVTDNQIKEILRRESDNATRRAAWEASKQIGGRVADGLRELARKRNAEARRLGFRDFFAMGLALGELDEDRLFRTFNSLEQLSEAPFAAYRSRLDESLARRFGVRPSEIRPWHFSDPFFQEAPPSGLSLDEYFEGRRLEPLARAHFQGMGLEVDDLLARADLYERPGKCQHAFCLAIDRRDDVRVLCNLVSNERWMETLLHELGHAVYDRNVDRGLPFLLREPAHILSTEAIAMLNGRFTRDATWLERVAGLDSARARELGGKLRQRTGEQLLILTRWVMVMSHFERDLYGDPNRELDSRWWDYVERFQRVQRPEGRSRPDWAAKIHFAVAPVYYQNYLLGEMMASQLARHVSQQVLGAGDRGLGALVGRREAGEYLRREVFAPGASHPWEEALRRATGEGLNPEHFVAEYAA